MEHTQMNVLLVEDDALNQLVARNLLQKWGLHVTIANNGAEAIQAIVSKLFQLVLMDIQMPIMDGLESTRRIRAMEDSYFKTVPIIAFTASGLIEAQRMVKQTGMDDVITKPFDARGMRNKIGKYISTLQRPLHINYDLYTEGNLDTKKELLALLINNMEELQATLSNALSIDTKFLLSSLNKAKLMISILNDLELSQILEEIKSICFLTNTEQLLEDKLEQCEKICQSVKESLLAEALATNKKSPCTGSTPRSIL